MTTDNPIVNRLPIKYAPPIDFFNEEKKCEHRITTKEKQVWAINLDLLQEMKRICDKYDIKWFIAYGSLLGTIRHKGFIPWDNDVDIWMTRDQFNKLDSVIQKELEEPYFWQTAVTEEGRFFSNVGRLCNSKTTSRWKSMYDLGINCGIYIDVLILDDVPHNTFLRIALKKYYRYYAHLSYFIQPYKFKFTSLGSMITNMKYILWNTVYKNWTGKDIFLKLNNICTGINRKGYSHCCCYGSPYSHEFFDKKWFKEVIWMDFETIKVPVPVGYHELLTSIYHDYMELPPIDKRATHDGFTMDATIPYKDFYGSL